MTAAFTASDPCPICGGHDRLQRGHGRRCHGFLDSTERYARCAREELAGGIEQGKDGLYPHKLTGRCRCGQTHGEAEERGRIVATYDYVDESGKLVFQVVRFEPKDFRQRRPDGAGGWIWKVAGAVPLVPYHLDELLAAVAADDPVLVTEGEKDADRVRALGLAATCNPGGAKKWRPEYADHIRGASDVRVIADRDRDGYQHAAEVAESLKVVGARVVVLEAATGKDVSDHLDAGHGLDELVVIDPAERIAANPRLCDGSTLHRLPADPIVVSIARVTTQRVEWLWPGRIPLGKLTVADGDPGLGKSLVTLDLASRTTTGKRMPDGTGGIAGGAGVVLLSAEDGLGDTIRPRLEAAGADLSRVVAFQAIQLEDGERLPILPDDVLRLEEIVRREHARLIVVDPLMAFLTGDANANRDHDVRRALAPLSAMAERTGAAVLVIRHLNKGSSSSANPVYRGGGSIGIIGAARSGLLVARDPDDADLRVLAVTKANLAAPAPALRFRIVDGERGLVVDWRGATDHTAASLLAEPATGEERTARDEAADWLREALAAGPLSAKEIQRLARSEGLADRTLDRAKAKLGVRARRTGFGPRGVWTWELPKSAISPNPSKAGALCEEWRSMPPHRTPTPPNPPIERQGGEDREVADYEEHGGHA